MCSSCCSCFDWRITFFYLFLWFVFAVVWKQKIILFSDSSSSALHYFYCCWLLSLSLNLQTVAFPLTFWFFFFFFFDCLINQKIVFRGGLRGKCSGNLGGIEEEGKIEHFCPKFWLFSLNFLLKNWFSLSNDVLVAFRSEIRLNKTIQKPMRPKKCSKKQEFLLIWSIKSNKS